MPDSVGSAFPEVVVQTCVIHLIRQTFRYASKKYWQQISGDLNRIYAATSRAELETRHFVRFGRDSEHRR